MKQSSKKRKANKFLSTLVHKFNTKGFKVFGVAFLALLVTFGVLVETPVFTRAQTVGSEVKLNDASKWKFLQKATRGSLQGKSPSANSAGGWFFNFPVGDGNLTNCYSGSAACPFVGYLEAPYPGSAEGGVMSATYRITASNGTVFNPSVSQQDGACTQPARARFLMHYNNDDFVSEFGRWYSYPLNIELKPGGPFTINVPMTGDYWQSVYGKHGADRPGSPADATAKLSFNGTVRLPRNVGIGFGGCFAAHGVNVYGGTAKMEVLNFSVKPAAVVPMYDIANFVSSASALPKLSKRSWTTVYGQNLYAGASCQAPAAPVTTLCGTSVKVNGQLVPISFLNKTQLNFLMPDTAGNLTVEVTSSGNSGNTVVVPVLDKTMDLYSQSGNGKGFVAATHYNTPNLAKGTAITTANPVKEGYYVILYGSGFGPFGVTSNKPTITVAGKAVKPEYIDYVGYTNGQYQVNIKKLVFSELGITQSGNYKVQVCGGGVCGIALDIPVVK